MNPRFVMAELRSLVARGLASSGYRPAKSARVRDIPDTRTIRYYTTLGLINRPAEMRGRTAMYDRSHVQQIVAIKRLQSQGLTLSDIQQRLAGLTAEQVEKIAALPPDFWEAAEPVVAAESTSNSQPREQAGSEQQPRAEPLESEESPFWAAPAAVPSEREEQEDHELEIPPPDTSAVTVGLTARISIHRDVELTIDIPSESLGSARVDEERLRAASRALLKELVRQGLTSPSSANSPKEVDCKDPT